MVINIIASAWCPMPMLNSRKPIYRSNFTEKLQTILQVAGSDQYFLADCPISQYKYVRPLWICFPKYHLQLADSRYIRQCIAKADTPHLMLMSKERVYSSLPHNDFHMPGKRTVLELPPETNPISPPNLRPLMYLSIKTISVAYMRKVATSPNSSSNSTDPLWRINHSFR